MQEGSPPWSGSFAVPRSKMQITDRELGGLRRVPGNPIQFQPLRVAVVGNVDPDRRGLAPQRQIGKDRIPMGAAEGPADCPRIAVRFGPPHRQAEASGAQENSWLAST